MQPPVAAAHGTLLGRTAEGRVAAQDASASGVLSVSPEDLARRALLIPVDGIRPEDLRDSFDE